MPHDETTKPGEPAAMVEPRPVIAGEERALLKEHPEPPATADAELEGRTLAAAPRKPHLHLSVAHFDAARDLNAKVGPGILRHVILNSMPGGMNGVMTIRDGQQGGGAVIAVITPAAGATWTMDYDAPFTKGLFLSLVGATPGDWTVVWE